MRLAQIAFCDMPQANRERYTYDAFVQSINDLGLYHQFLAMGVTTVEGAFAVGETYILASHMHRNAWLHARWTRSPPLLLPHQMRRLQR